MEESLLPVSSLECRSDAVIAKGSLYHKAAAFVDLVRPFSLFSLLFLFCTFTVGQYKLWSLRAMIKLFLFLCVIQYERMVWTLSCSEQCLSELTTPTIKQNFLEKTEVGFFSEFPPTFLTI